MANPREQKPAVHSKKHIARLERERRQTRYILGGFICILVILIGLVAYGYLDINFLQPRRPVAEIGDETISVMDWQARVRMERRRMISDLQLYEQYQQYLGVDLSNLEEAKQAYLEAVEIGQAAGDVNLIIVFNSNLANIMVEQGSLRQADRIYAETFRWRPDQMDKRQ